MDLFYVTKLKKNLTIKVALSVFTTIKKSSIIHNFRLFRFIQKL